MHKRISIGAAITLILIAIAITFSVTTVFTMRKFNDMMNNIKGRETMYEIFAELDKKIRQNYYGEINEEAIKEAVAKGYISGLYDGYSKYYTADEYKELQSSTEGIIIGIGVEAIKAENGYLQVTKVYPDSSASAAGILEGDLIVKVDGENVTASTSDVALNKLTGVEGSKVSLITRRDAVDQDEMILTYRVIEIPTVSYKMLEDRIGYIYISAFKNNTSDQFATAMGKLIDDGADAIIFDVRNNDTGIIRSVSEILDRLLPQGNIVSAVKKDGTNEVLAYSDSLEYDVAMAVVVNERSEEMAEIFAQAIKDSGKGKVIGKRTAGKGVMQETIKLDGGGALLLTTAAYSLPKSGSFNGTGVVPNYDVELIGGIVDDIGTLDPLDDSQLQKAIEVVKGSLRAEDIENSESSESSSFESEVSAESSENSEVNVDTESSITE